VGESRNGWSKGGGRRLIKLSKRNKQRRIKREMRRKKEKAAAKRQPGARKSAPPAASAGRRASTKPVSLQCRKGSAISSQKKNEAKIYQTSNPKQEKREKEEKKVKGSPGLKGDGAPYRIDRQVSGSPLAKTVVGKRRKGEEKGAASAALSLDRDSREEAARDAGERLRLLP